MSNILGDLAKVELPGEVLKQIDLEGMAREFRDNYAKLDDFKKAKQKHENRSIGEKLWGFITLDDTLEKAQYAAQVVQGDFLKVTGRLMVLNIMLSKQLEQQQDKLSSQQQQLKMHTGKIAEQADEIDDQQKKLAMQNDELKKLVEDYFELKGLTRNGAEKLIAIAQEIANTKDFLLKSVKNDLEKFQKKVDNIETNFTEENIRLKNFSELLVNTSSKNWEKKFSEQVDDINKLKGSTQEALLALSESAQRMSAEVFEKFKQNETSLKLILAEIFEEQNQFKNELAEQINQNDQSIKLIHSKMLEEQTLLKIELTEQLREVNGKHLQYKSDTDEKIKWMKVGFGAISTVCVGLFIILFNR